MKIKFIALLLFLNLVVHATVAVAQDAGDITCFLYRSGRTKIFAALQIDGENIGNLDDQGITNAKATLRKSGVVIGRKKIKTATGQRAFTSLSSGTYKGTCTYRDSDNNKVKLKGNKVYLADF